MAGTKSTPLTVLSGIIGSKAENISDYVKHKGDFTKKRKLDAEKTIKVAMNMQGNCLNAELVDAFPDANDRMTASAFVQAKGKLCPEVFEDIFHEYNATMEPKTMDAGKHYRVYAIDGTDFRPPYVEGSSFTVPYSEGKKNPDGSDSKPYSLVHGAVLYDILDRTLEDAILRPKMGMDDRLDAVEMLGRLDHGSPFITIMDIGFDGVNMMETLNRMENCHYIIRTKPGGGSLRCIQGLPDEELDMDMEVEVTTSQTYYRKWCGKKPNLKFINHPTRHYKETRSKNTRNRRWDFEPHCFVRFRAVKFQINDPDNGKPTWEVLLTNLDRSGFPIAKMKEMYHMRWDVETSFRELKYALGAIQFHSKRDDFILMELFCHFAMFNAISRSIARVRLKKKESNRHSYAVEFKMAVKIIRKYYRLFCRDLPGSVFDELARYTVPIREGRRDKRNIKQKPAVWFVYRVA